MTLFQHFRLATLFFALLFSINSSAQVHTSYLWHMQQPIYWSEQSVWDTNRYQMVWESQVLKNNGSNVYADGLAHPLNNLQEIFSKPDRSAVYQYRCKDAVQTLLGLPEAGAQVNYSGCLIENVNSLAESNQWGYSENWEDNFITAYGWKTSGNQPRLDMTAFTFHHVLSPLVSENVLRKELQAHRVIFEETFGPTVAYGKGYWPAECSFSERIIKVLAEEGIEWSVVANSHLSRTLKDYPINYGTSGCNIDPPNKADIVSTNGNNWWNGQIDGRGGTFAAPYCYQVHKAKYVDPNTGTEYKIDVVPMADLLSYQNGFSTMSTGEIDANIAPYEDPNHPSLVLMAHDGDNAWGGGYDYYLNSVPGLANAAASKGYVPTTIQQFLNDHPVPEDDVVHVEDGSWVNAANDWGHPQFINWLWPLYDNNYRFDPNGWTEDARNWAVLTAAENRVQMAEDLSSNVDISDVVAPDVNSSLAERAWHFLLPGFTSGYMYYGTAIDMEVKPSLASNLACKYANKVIDDNANSDMTPPSVFIPQRFPYNPGGKGFGPIYGYQEYHNSSDFHVWTFAYDVSGMNSVVLKYRVDFDGTNPLASNQNESYQGGNEVSNWQTINMTERIFPKGNITNNSDIDFFIEPNYIANQYYAEIANLSDTLVDYYVEATDNKGNVFKTPIQHVYVGAYTTSNGGNEPNITWSPSVPTKNDTIEITINNATQSGRLHWGVNAVGNNWQSPIADYWPANSFLFNGSGPAVQSPLSDVINNQLKIKIGPFNNTSQTVETVDFVINYNDNSWDNNNGLDYHIPILNNVDSITYIDTSLCSGDTIIVSNIPIYSSGIQTLTFVAMNGEDSVVVIETEVIEEPSSFTSITTCAAITWNGQTFSESGNYSVIIDSDGRCDSVATLNLLILDAVFTIENYELCVGESATINGVTYTSSTTIYDTLTALSGCDSIVQHQLNFNDLPNINSIEGASTAQVNSNQNYGVSFNAGSSYEWTVTNGEIVGSAYGNTISVNWTSAGTATISVVETNAAGCVGNTFSITVEVTTTTNFETLLVSRKVKIFPNPMQVFTTVYFENAQASNIRLELTDILGKTHWSQSFEQDITHIERGNLNAGLYFINFYEANKLIGSHKLVID